MSKKILVIAGDAVEALEIYYPYYRCLEQGYEVTIAAPSVKKLHTVSHDFIEGHDTYVEKPAYLIEATKSFSEIEPSEYDGLIIPGGRSPEYIRLEKEIPTIVKHFFEKDKPIAVVCHAAQILAVVPEVLQGRSLTAYIACKPEVSLSGATYIEDALYVDKNLVSGHAWPDLPGLMKHFIEQVEAS